MNIRIGKYLVFNCTESVAELLASGEGLSGVAGERSEAAGVSAGVAGAAGALAGAAGVEPVEIPSDYEVLLGGEDFAGGALVEAGSGVELAVLVLPGEDVSLKISATMSQEGSSLSLRGAYICSGSQRVSLSTTVRHAVGSCYSLQLFKGILSGEARSNFAGRIIVDHGAEKTESYQENHNLLLSQGALAVTQPELEIYADDVKCNHGATVGYLSEDEQFYMRSRGISREEAERLQIISFLSTALVDFPSEILEVVL